MVLYNETIRKKKRFPLQYSSVSGSQSLTEIGIKIPARHNGVLSVTRSYCGGVLSHRQNSANMGFNKMFAQGNEE